MNRPPFRSACWPSLLPLLALVAGCAGEPTQPDAGGPAAAGLAALPRQPGRADPLSETSGSRAEPQRGQGSTRLTPPLGEADAALSSAAANGAIPADADSRESSIPRVSSKNVTLSFQGAPLSVVLEALSKETGATFALAPEVSPALKINLFVTDRPADEAVVALARATGMEVRPVGERSFVMTSPTAALQRGERKARTFYLANADVKQVAQLIRTVLRPRDLFVDERLRQVVVVDTADQLKLAERLIASQDLADAEVEIAVEILEVTKNRLEELGVLPPSQLKIGLRGASDTPGSLSVSELRRLSGDGVLVQIGDPAIAINLQADHGNARLLANPRIRIKSHQKGKVVIGDKLPVISAINNTVGVSSVVSEQVTYVDAGLKLEVEPEVHLTSDVSIQLSLEVSRVVNQITSKNGTTAYQLGTRSLSTSLRLKNGETQVMAGLISSEDRRSSNGLPGLGELPLIGRLFSSKRDSRDETEVVLLLTPTIVRQQRHPPDDETAVDVSAGAASSGLGVSGQGGSISYGPTGPKPAATSPRPAP